MSGFTRRMSAEPDRRTTFKTAGIAILCLAAGACSQAGIGTYAHAPLAGAGKVYAGKAYSTKGAGSLINGYRRRHGLGSVSRDASLRRAAVTQARLMARHQIMGHTTGWGTDFGTRIQQAGVIHRAAAENVSVGYRTVAGTMAGWMRSAGHRRNMLDRQFTRYGVAVAKDARGRPYWALVLAN